MSYHNINKPKPQSLFNSEWTKEHTFISKSCRDAFHGFAHCVAVKCIYVFLLFPEVQIFYVFRHCARLFFYLCVSLISRSPEMLCFQALCPIIFLFMCFFDFQKSRNVMFSGTVPDYFFYLCVSLISRSPEMLCFQALCALQDRFISVVSF